MSSALLLIALFTAVPAAAGDPASPVDRGPLTASEPAEAEIGPHGAHTFTLSLEPDRAYSIGIDQLDAYVEVTWSAEGQTRKTNDRAGRTGREEVFWVAGAAGPATLTVRNLGGQAGRYRATLAEPLAATGADRDRHRAEIDATTRDMAARRRAADLFAVLGLVHRQVRVLDRMSYLGVGIGEFALAREAAEECVTVARRAALETELSSCLCAHANALHKAGDHDRARVLYDEAIAMREAAADPGPLAAALNDSSELLVVRGDYDAAEARKQRALGLAREAGDELGEAVLLMGLGALSAYRGDTESAVAAFENGAVVVRRLGHRQLEALALVNASIAYGSLGDIGRALARGREAAAVAREAGLKPALANAHLTLGAEHDDAGDLEAAERELTAGVALAREIQDPLLVATGEALLGWVLGQRGDAEAAESHLTAALASAREAGSKLEEANAYQYQGKARIRSSRLADAEASLLQARTMFEALGRTDNLGQVQTALAQVALARGELPTAFERSEAALGHFESMRTRVALADQRARYFALRRGAYDVAVAILLERERREPGQGHLERAFAMTERARDRSLQEELAARGMDWTAAPPALSERHRRALDRIGHVQRELVGAHTQARPEPGTIDRMERDLAVAIADEESARAEMRRLAPRAIAATAAPLSATEHAKRLRPDEALLEYHVGADSSWLFVIAPDGPEVLALPGARALRAEVDELRRLVASPRLLGARQYAVVAHRLFGTLLQPALAHRPLVRRLRIVPDGPLWELPFEALLTAPARDGGYAGLPYVVRRFTVSYQPSARKAVPEAAAAGPRSDLVAFADPPLPPANRRPDAAAGVERAVFREGDRWSLAALPCARQEARDAAALFGPARASVHVGAAALESRVKSDPDVGRARYLLFATHGLVSETMPSQSALVLSLEGDGAEDGLLQAHEIDRLQLEAELVVLSACETALGQNVRGEGLLGLARAFFHAGARRLLATQWRVGDCSTAALTTDLFRRLQAAPAAPDFADALRRAKLRLLAQPAYAHPYYWAPFVLVG